MEKREREREKITVPQVRLYWEQLTGSSVGLCSTQTSERFLLFNTTPAREE